MMLESIRKLMAKSKEGSCLQFPQSHSTLGHGPPHTGGNRPGAWTRQPDAIKLRPSQPISNYVQRFPPRTTSGRDAEELRAGGGARGTFWGRGLIRGGLAKRSKVQQRGLKIQKQT